MPNRRRPTEAVCLGDELQDLSDEEQRQYRIHLELEKDQAVEVWEAEMEVSHHKLFYGEQMAKLGD